MPVATLHQVEVYRARSIFEAHVIRLALNDAGIPATIENEDLQFVGGELPNAWAAAPRIQVDESQAIAARELIERIQDSKQNALASDEPDVITRCLSCGNSIEIDEEKCSSCGWSYLGESPDFDEFAKTSEK